MASKKRKGPKSEHGIRRLGVKDGKTIYEVRLLGVDPATKKRIVDTLRKVEADTLAEAMTKRDELTAKEVALKLGVSFAGGRLRVRDAVTVWTGTITRHSTSNSWSSYARRFVRDFGDRWLHLVQTKEIQLWLNRQPDSFSTVSGIRTALIALFDWATDSGHDGDGNPARSTKVKNKRHSSDVALKLAELETPKKTALTREELQKYGSAHRRLHPQTYPLVLAMVALGARFSEASALKRTDINWKTGVVTIRRAQVNGRLGPPKADKARLNAFGPDVLSVLRGHVAATGENVWLFPSPKKRPGARRPAKDAKGNELAQVWSYHTVGRHIKSAMKAAGVYTDNVAHFARHTMISLTRGRMPDPILREFVGHASEQVHQGYGMEPIREIAKTMDLALFRKAKR